MKVRVGIVLAASAAIAAGGCAASGGGGASETVGPAGAGALVSSGTPPRDNTYTRSAALYLSRAQQNPDPSERRQRFQEALTASIDGITNQPGNPKSYMQAGQSYIGLTDLVGADSMWTKAEDIYPAYFIEIDPQREQQWVNFYNQGINQIQAGASEDAIPLLERAHSIYRGRPEAMLNLASVHAQLANDDEAIRWYNESLELMRGPKAEEQTPETLEGWAQNEEIAAFNVAQILASAGRNDEAEAAYREFLEGDPENVTALSNLAVVLMNMERGDEAGAIYEGLLARTDLSARDYFVTGIGLFNAENYPLASQAFGRSYELIPNSRDAVYNYAQTLYLDEQYEELLPVARALMEMDPYNNNVYRILAQALVRSGEEQEAVQILEAMEALEYEIDNTRLQSFGGGGGIVFGELLNHSREGGEIGVRVHFYGMDGNEVGTTEIAVPVPAADMIEVFQTQLDSDQDIAAYSFEVIS